MHIKRLSVPHSWPTARKGTTYLTKPLPGQHSLGRCLPVAVIFRELLQCTQTKRETRRVLAEGVVLVDKKPVKDHRYGIGLLDRFEITKTGENYTMLLNENGRLCLRKVAKADMSTKPCKIIGKKILKGKKVQLNLYDGKNILVDKDTYRVGDSIVVSLPDLGIKKHLPLQKGAIIFITAGKHIGKTATVTELKEFKNFEEDRLLATSTTGEPVETLKKYAFVVEKDMNHE